MSGADGVPQSSELTGGPGFRIRTAIDRPPADVIERFSSLDVALVSDVMNRLYTARPGLRPVSPSDDATLVGPACTVKVYPGDNLMLHAALDIAEPGDVVVVDTAGNETSAVLGDMIANKAKSRGIAGFVVDGLVRDVVGIIESGMPVFARGTTPRGPLHRGPGELNHPIVCGGVSVQAGDVMLASRDGVVIVPGAHAEAVADRVFAKSDREADYVAAVKRGEFSNDWVDDLLRRSGCEFS